ncbi:hypothetical protein HDK64DRAFT_248917 [Phyllosticta capitalensis]
MPPRLSTPFPPSSPSPFSPPPAPRRRQNHRNTCQTPLVRVRRYSAPRKEETRPVFEWESDAHFDGIALDQSDCLMSFESSDDSEESDSMKMETDEDEEDTNIDTGLTEMKSKVCEVETESKKPSKEDLVTDVDFDKPQQKHQKCQRTRRYEDTPIRRLAARSTSAPASTASQSSPSTADSPTGYDLDMDWEDSPRRLHAPPTFRLSRALPILSSSPVMPPTSPVFRPVSPEPVMDLDCRQDIKNALKRQNTTPLTTRGRPYNTFGATSPVKSSSILMTSSPASSEVFNFSSSPCDTTGTIPSSPLTSSPLPSSLMTNRGGMKRNRNLVDGGDDEEKLLGDIQTKRVKIDSPEIV